jgi:hypothetical protein
VFNEIIHKKLLLKTAYLKELFENNINSITNTNHQRQVLVLLHQFSERKVPINPQGG